MALFYLHLCNGSGFVPDDEGQDLFDLDEARRTAVASLRDVLAGEVRQGNINTGSFIEIEDEHHRHVATVHFAEAVEVTSETARSPRPLP